MTQDQEGHGSPVFPHQLSPALPLPLNFLPGRDIFKFIPPETPHSQLFWLRSQCPQLPAIRRGPEPRPFVSPCKSPADTWHWTERQFLAIHWKPLMAGWPPEFQRTDFSALGACSPFFSLTPPSCPLPLRSVQGSWLVGFFQNKGDVLCHGHLRIPVTLTYPTQVSSCALTVPAWQRCCQHSRHHPDHLPGNWGHT